MTNAITFTALGYAYHPGRSIFRGYDGAVTRGKSFAVLGANGSGKTTLLKLMLGVMPPTEGKVAVHGNAAFVPQLFQVSFDYSLLDIVLMGRAKKVGLLSQPSAKDERMALGALDRFGLADQARRPFHELSGGQRQIVTFARALVAEADILILDEPTSALDFKNQELILGWINRLSREDGLTVVFTTHHPHHALAVADDVLLMLGNGKYVCGPAGETLTEDNLHALYDVRLKRLSFEHAGHRIETFAPILALNAAVSRPHISPL